MLGYWNNPEATAAAITADGWFKTGDAGYLDDDGFLYLHDRVKDMIVSGGENVYPAEVENVLDEHPDVADVAVIGVPDERWGEAVKAIVVRRDRHRAERGRADRLRPRAARRVTSCPKSVDFAEVLPRNPSRQAAQARAARALLGGPRAAASADVPKSAGDEAGAC